MITLISTPVYPYPENPSVVSRWVATESPNNFRLLRRDWICGTPVNNGGYLQVTVTEAYTGSDGNTISIYDLYSDSMLTGEITNVDGTLLILTTDIPFNSNYNPVYLNDYSLYGGYYFEGRLTINDVVYPLTIIASPDTFGYGDLDVSGILRIVTSLGKTADHSERIMIEPTKSGNFGFEYRGCWYGSDNEWEAVEETSPETSPPTLIKWYYAEAVRSVEQGSNLYDYVPNEIQDAPFFNQFEEPTYFLGLPFDLSFIMPETDDISPASDIQVDIKIYDSNNQLLHEISEDIAADDLEGFVCSLNIDETTVPTGAAYLTAEISTD
jgi:hypothetical protein